MLTGKVAFVTGAARGIGRSIAQTLARLGCRVACADVQADIAEVAATYPGQATGVRLDVSDWHMVDAAIDQIEQHWGTVDILVNNAALVKNISRVEQMAPAAWNQELAVNLSGPFYLTRRVLPAMVEKRWGRIINISSIAVRGLDRQASYAASKSGLIGLTRTVALEHAVHGITCNAIVPGLIGTENVHAMPEQIRDEALHLIPARRLGEPREVAETVAFLASPAAGYINGAIIPVDGGAGLNQMTLARRRK